MPVNVTYTTGSSPDLRPGFYSRELPPWPTLEEIRKVVRDELKKAGLNPGG